MTFRWGFSFELFSGAGGREFHFILYICSLLFGGLPFSLLKKKLNYNWRQPGAGGNPVDENCNLQYGRFQKKPQQETQSLKTRHVIISFRNKPKSEETQGTLISMGSWNFFRKLYFFHVS